MRSEKVLPTHEEGEDGDGALQHLMEAPPTAIKQVLFQFIEQNEAPEVVTSADMTPDGQYGETWVMATPRRVVVYDPDHGSPQTREIRLADLEKVDKIDFVGNGALRFTTSRDACEVRFSLSQSSKFDDVRDVIESLRGKERKESDDENRKGNGRRSRRGLTPEALRARVKARAKRSGRCQKCGRLLPYRHGVCPLCLERTRLLMRLFPYLQPYLFFVVLNLILMFITTGLGLLPPFLTKTLLDDVFPKRNLSLLFIVLGALLGSNLANSVLGSIRSYMTTWLQQRIVIRLRTQLYTYLHQLSLSFYDRQSVGHLIQRVMSDTSALQSFIATGMVEIIQNVMTIFIISATMLLMDWKLALVTLLPVPLMVMGNQWYARKVYRIYQRIWRQSARLSSILTDTLPGVRVVKAFAQENREVKRFIAQNELLLATNLRAAHMSRVFQPIMGLLSTIGTMSIWAVGGYMVISSGSITPGVLMAFLQYLHRFYQPVHALCNMNERIQSVAASAERVFELIDTKPDVEDDPDAVELPEIQGHVRFDDTSFGYDTGTKVLEGISLDVQPGEMIGLVGHSGAGKSTLINLICRFYDVTEGTISVDGHDIRKVKLNSLRSQIGVVLQEPYLFRGTIAENIAYGHPDATREEIVRAAIAANAHEFICRAADGYDTMIGERGGGISGGERQRISIARAILKSPRILILDEATASVDTQTEAKIREAVERLVQGRTTFAIAHRLSTLRSANRLVVLDKGKIVEVGTHEELLAKEDGAFKKLWNMQMDVARRHQEVLSV
ncbi:MAG: ABC transporter ATP-binding protein [Armatimonadetes bacterium]|nr:ABC transporter ATP-binding protein [Armatimonadota bacterium]